MVQSYRRAPKAITLDVDDTFDAVHGHQQLSMFNAHYDERCFLPIHVYDADTGHCVLTILRPGKTPDGKEVVLICVGWCDASGCIGQTRITIRGDSHYGRREAMDWCEQNRVHYIFGLSTNAVLAAQVFAKTDDVCVRRATGNLDVVRDYTETRYAAKSWLHLRRVGTDRGDAERSRCSLRRFPTSTTVPPRGSTGDSLLRTWAGGEPGQRRKSQLASDRTSCRSPLANQMRLILRTAAYWLMLKVRGAILHATFGQWRILHHPPAVAEDCGAGSRTTTRIKLAFAANCPNAALFRGLVGALIPRPT